MLVMSQEDLGRAFFGILLTVVLILIYHGVNSLCKSREEARKNALETDHKGVIQQDIQEAKAMFEKEYDYASPDTEGAVEILILDKDYRDGDGPNLKIHVWGTPKYLTRAEMLPVTREDL